MYSPSPGPSQSRYVWLRLFSSTNVPATPGDQLDLSTTLPLCANRIASVSKAFRRQGKRYAAAEQEPLSDRCETAKAENLGVTLVIRRFQNSFRFFLASLRLKAPFPLF